MGSMSMGHWLIVLAILLVFFGPSRLPGLGKSIGEAIKGFKEGIDSVDAKNSNVAQNQQAPQQQLQQPSQAQATAQPVADKKEV